MKQWEDIVKDKLEGYESTLPEGSLAEFRALREGKAAAPAKKAAPWIWGIAAAVAAGLAAILFLRQPETPQGHYPIAQPVAEINLPSLVAQVTPLKTPRQKTLKRIPKKNQADRQDDTPIQAIEGQEDTSETFESPSPAEPSVENIKTAEPSSITITLPQKETVKVSMPAWIVSAAGGLAGAGSLTALASNIAKKETPVAKMGKNMRDELAEWSGPGQVGIGSDPGNPIIPEGDSVRSFKHFMPVKAGVSARIPVSEKLFITTGLDYTLYTSRFTFTLSGEKTQYAHYLSVPARMDWVFASGKVLDVYIGGGLQGDFCVGASLAGNQLKKDGFSLSLLGSGGLQLNASKRLGFYLEPQLSWPFYTANNSLITYRSEHPVMFSVATGIRINLGK